MNLKKLAEAIGKQRVLLHIDGIGIREMAINDIVGILLVIKRMDVRWTEDDTKEYFLSISTEPEPAKPDPFHGWTPETLVAEARKRNPYTKNGSNFSAYGVCCLTIEDLIQEGKK